MHNIQYDDKAYESFQWLNKLNESLWQYSCSKINILVVFLQGTVMEEALVSLGILVQLCVFGLGSIFSCFLFP